VKADPDGIKDQCSRQDLPVTTGRAKITYSKRDCDTRATEIAIDGAPGCAHIWGRGLEEWRWLGGDNHKFSFVPPSAPTHGQYFIQLFDECWDEREQSSGVELTGELSPIYSFDTDPKRCRIKVGFIIGRLSEN
jgi:hypothetical protein